VKKTKVLLVVNGFANQIWNQILAIPTKNLFVWSMQNIGRVNTFGYETRIEAKRQIRKNWSVEAILNYTYQYSIDVSNPTSPTYLHQVAYIPRHTGNIDYTLKRKNTGMHVSVITSSIRYSLMENIPANEVKGFTIVDAGIFTKIKLEKEHDLRIQFSVKNISDSSYAYIRYFVMPGRNYLITLNYALH
jgi:outer membrane receptor protein involved in Fe transport